MTNLYIKGGFLGHLLRRLGLTTALLSSAALAAQAQSLNYLVSGATNTTTTYTDLGTAGTPIATADTDDANSAAQDIGFTFRYNSLNFTQFTLNTNGFIKLGAVAPSDTKLFISETNASQVNVFGSANDPNIIAPFNFDLTAGTATPEYRVATSGNAPNRVCTIQWKNVSDKAATNPTQYTNLSFQVRLYETTGVIELVYNSPTVGATSALRFVQAGLKGTSFDSGQLVQPIKQSMAAWSSATFADYATAVSNNAYNTLNIRSVVPPDAGRTFRFTPIPDVPNDAAVSVIYTLGKLAVPAALPHAVRAVITNAGSGVLTNVPVTLSVTGANTFTSTKNVASLAVGATATVTFDNYPATFVVGTNVVNVSVPADGNTANNSLNYGQLITADRLTYFDPTGTTVGPIGTSNGVFATKFTVAAPTVVSDVTLTFAANANNTAAYQVLLYDVNAAGQPGTVLYTSASRNRTAAGGVVAVPVPNITVPAIFFVALKQVTNAGIAFQTESPIRSGTYYFSVDGGASFFDFTQSTVPARAAIEVGIITPGCSAPTAVAVSSLTPNSATVSFTAPTSGTSGYQVVYGPAGFDPATAGTTLTPTASPVVITGLTPATIYQVYVRSVCTTGGFSAFTQVVNFTTACDPNTTVSAFPYSQNFDIVLAGQPLPCGISTLDANGDGTTWALSNAAPNSGTYSMRYRGILLNNVAANDWFFSPPLATTAGTRYQVAFRYRAEGIAPTPSASTEGLEVKYGPATTVAGQTTTLFSNTAITNTTYTLANGASAPAVAVMTPGAGTQYVGFHAISAANQANLYVDDLSISTVLATTSEALLRAVTVFPNPSTTGLFDLDIHGANAKGSLEVRVTNTLGQQVYTGTARDNATNRLDLGGLAAGIYHLQVRQGDDFVTRTVSIVK